MVAVVVVISLSIVDVLSSIMVVDVVVYMGGAEVDVVV